MGAQGTNKVSFLIRKITKMTIYFLKPQLVMAYMDIYFSSHHSFSFLTWEKMIYTEMKIKTKVQTCSSSLGVKSFLILKVFLISSGVLPLIMLATVLHVTSNNPYR